MVTRAGLTAAPLAVAGVLALAAGGVATAAAATVTGVTAPSTVTTVTSPTTTSSLTSTTSTVTSTLHQTVTAVTSKSPTSTGGTTSSAPVARRSSTVTVVPAPPGSASATGVRVDPLDTCVSCTSAQAGPGGSSADGTALRILGTDVAAGSVVSNGDPNDGALIALPANPLLNLAIADWMTAAHATPAGSQASARTALVDLDLADGQVATVAVLESTSNASWTPMASHGDAATNGVDLNVGQGALVIILLHSDASSDGTGDAYVASINGTEILSSSQTGGGIPITIPGVITITLLQVNASGGAGSALVGQVSDLGGTPGEVGLVLGTTGQGSNAPSSTPTPAPTPSPSATPTPAPTATPSPSANVQSLATTSEGPSTPLTGVGLGLLGVVLLVGGVATLVLAVMRRRQQSPASA